MEALNFLLAPFVMCLILVGIHCYLGLHVLKRGIIFIDLSLAQVASLGSTVALLFHLEHNETGTYFLSLGFTLLAALFFSIVKKIEDSIPQEVIIAIVYALSSAAVILVVNSLAHGSEHIKEILTGKILWVTWEDVLKTLGIYSIVGAIHYLFRKELIATSFGKAHSLKWDFVFYALFGIVITSSVGTAGILLVFSFLIVPALVSTIFKSELRAQLIFGWAVGAILSTIGMVMSYKLDLPAGATMVVVFTCVPLFLAIGLIFKGFDKSIS